MHVFLVMWEEQKSDPLASAARNHFSLHYDVILGIYRVYQKKVDNFETDFNFTNPSMS
jgi:hypothetical protein